MAKRVKNVRKLFGNQESNRTSTFHNDNNTKIMVQESVRRSPYTVIERHYKP